MSFATFRRRHPNFVALFTVLMLAALTVDGWLIYKRIRYEREIAQLQASMSDVERRRTGTILARDERRLQMMMELIRRQARGSKEIHLAVAVDSAILYLGREGAVLRDVPVTVGPERRVGTPPDTVRLAVPRGARAVQRVLGRTSVWEVPAWVYRDRNLPVPEQRKIAGALGPAAIILQGGTIIYSLPSTGPLADSTYVLPGAVRAAASDLRAILPNLKRGTAVYFY